MGAGESAAAPPAERRPGATKEKPRTSAASEPPREPPPSVSAPPVPTVLDFYPLEDAKYTQVHAFFEHLKSGRFTTTRCRRDGQLLWPPRVACPKCHGTELDWVDLPLRGRLYAFSAVLAGAPLGMEAEVPFSVGLVDLEGVPLRLFGRIEGAPWNELAIGDAVRVVPVALPDGRIFYRFQLEARSTAGRG